MSGINAGGNLGDDVLYSGTVAAALEGRHLGLPAMAVSLVGRNPQCYETARRGGRTVPRRARARIHPVRDGSQRERSGSPDGPDRRHAGDQARSPASLSSRRSGPRPLRRAHLLVRRSGFGPRQCTGYRLSRGRPGFRVGGRRSMPTSPGTARVGHHLVVDREAHHRQRILTRLFALGLVVLFAGGCGALSGGARAPAAVRDVTLAERGGGSRPAVHVVRPRETLSAIAWRYGLDYRSIARWNRIAPPYVIFPGQRLALRGAEARAARATGGPSGLRFRSRPEAYRAGGARYRSGGGMDLAREGAADRQLRKGRPGRYRHRGTAGTAGGGRTRRPGRVYRKRPRRLRPPRHHQARRTPAHRLCPQQSPPRQGGSDRPCRAPGSPKWEAPVRSGSCSTSKSEEMENR